MPTECVCMTRITHERETLIAGALACSNRRDAKHAVIKQQHTQMRAPAKIPKGGAGRFVEAVRSFTRQDTHNMRVVINALVRSVLIPLPGPIFITVSPHCHVLDSSLGSARCHAVSCPEL